MDISFSKEELERYSRHILIPEFNVKGQQKLKASRLLVVGAGGLGNPVLSYLAAAGLGTIGIIDDDLVEPSNLQRQVLFRMDDVGQSKAIRAANILSGLNPNVHFESYHDRLTTENGLEILKDYDVIVDCTDNLPTRYLINDASIILKKPYVYASIYQYEGQVAVFNHPNGGTRPVNYRDVFPEPPPPEQVPSCSEGGVLGVLPGIIGSVQANEALKLASGVGVSLAGRLYILDAFTMESRTIEIPVDTNQKPIEELDDYVHFCGLESNPSQNMKVKEITVRELHEMRSNGEDYQLIDVREPYERDIAHIDGDLIPMAEIPDRVSEISKDRKVIVHCRSGSRSANTIVFLERKFGMDNLYNLKGGILAWADEIDDSLAKY